MYVRTNFLLFAVCPTIYAISNKNKSLTSETKLGKQLLIEGASIIIYVHCAQKKEMKLVCVINDFTPSCFNFSST